MTTNIQSFAGDVEIAGNLSVPSGITGVASSATALQTARNIALAGDVTGTVAFDGSQDISMSTTLVGGFNASDSPINIGPGAGTTSQESNTIAIGVTAGYTGQNAYAVAIGNAVGYTNQGSHAIAVGYGAGQSNQGNNSVAVGLNSALTSQGVNAVAVGNASGQSGQGNYSVAIGTSSGKSNQGSNSTAVGYNAGSANQGSGATAVGYSAGLTNQGGNATAIGYLAGSANQGASSLAIGYSVGRSNQGSQTTGIGYLAACRNQKFASVAIGRFTGRDALGSYSIAIGASAGLYNQSDNSICINATGSTLNNTTASTCVIKPISGSATANADLRYNSSTGRLTYLTSDDRIKDNEVFVTDATRSLMKLKPQTYDKRTTLDPAGIIEGHETGLMAQDIWYDAPELRHLVVVNETANPTPEKPPSATGDPRDDPDYSAWGSGISTIDYTQLISYLIKGFQEIVVELPRVKNPVVGEPGLIVSSSGVKDTLTVSSIPNDPTWFGVISSEKGLVDTKGPTRIWVVNTNGSLNIGDLVTTASIPGHAQKQDDDLLRSVSVAKVTQVCSFTEPDQVAILRPKREEKDVTYYIAQRETLISQSDYDQIGQERNRRKETLPMYKKGENDEITPEAYESLPNENGDTKLDYTLFQKTNYYRVENFETKYPRVSHPIVEVRQELVDVLDENGQIVWEETGETEPVYTLVDHGTYKAALVSCKLI